MSARQVDKNGYWEIVDNPISKAGVYPYLGVNLPNAPDPLKIYNVLRPPEELGRPETVDSFRLQPWIISHAMLGPAEKGLTPPEEQGVHGVIGENVWFDGETNTLFGNIKGFSEELKDQIERGIKELSAGYFHDVEWKSGVWSGVAYDAVQRNIRANHLALVRSGRMGSEVAVMDSNQAYDPNVFTIKKGQIMESDDSKQTAQSDEDLKVAQGDEENKAAQGDEENNAPATLESLAEAIKALTGRMDRFEGNNQTAQGDEENKAAQADEEGSTAKIDEPNKADQGDEASKAGEGDEAGAEKEGHSMDAALRTVMAGLSARNNLAKRLQKRVGTFDHSVMTEADVARYGVAKLGVKCPKGQEKATLLGYLAAAEQTASVSFSMDAALTRTPVAKSDPALSAYLKGE